MGKLFEGIRVLDFSNNLAGPYAGTMLADFGAEVIKIERPVVGDDTRGFNPQINGYSISGLRLNRGKKSVEIALDDPEGIALIKKMIVDADIVIQAFRPGVMKKFGLDYESVIQIKPDIIYCSISAFGQEGPLAHKPGYDLIAQGLSGVMEITGEKDGPPMKFGVLIGDYVGTLNAYGSISAALYHRAMTGEGQHIDISLLDGLVASTGNIENAQVMGRPVTRSGNHQPSALCPYGVFNGKDNQSIVICAPNNKLWAIICKVMGKEDCINHPDFDSALSRIANLPKVIDIIESWLKNFDNIDDAVKVLDEASIPCCKIMKPHELVNDENVLAREMLVDFEIPKQAEEPAKTIKSTGVWIKMSKTPGKIGKAETLGNSNHEILSRYGLTDQQIDELEGKWKAQVVEARAKAKAKK